MFVDGGQELAGRHFSLFLLRCLEEETSYCPVQEGLCIGKRDLRSGAAVKEQVYAPLGTVACFAISRTSGFVFAGE